jgi:hypothetical protein
MPKNARSRMHMLVTPSFPEYGTGSISRYSTIYAYCVDSFLFSGCSASQELEIAIKPALAELLHSSGARACASVPLFLVPHPASLMIVQFFFF